MASYPPPTETLPIFDAGVFTTNDSTLTISQADARYLKFPTGQGTETIPNLVVSGTSTLATTTATTLNALEIKQSVSFGASVGLSPMIPTSATGDYNVAFGNSVFPVLTSGNNNVGMGAFTGLYITTGAKNTAVGSNSLRGANVNSCTAIGANTLYNATGSNNIAIGTDSANALTSGTSNTIVGTSANQTGNPTNCTIIGADATCASYTKSTAIGKDATATASNQVVLGTATESVAIPNQIGFTYTTLPTFVSSSIGYTQSFTLANLVNGTGSRNTTNTSIALPVGVYMCTLYYQIDITFPTTTRTLIEFLVASNATLVNNARLGFVYAPAVQEYNYYSFPAILKVTTNPCSVYSQLTSSGGNCNISGAVLSVVRIA